MVHPGAGRGNFGLSADVSSVACYAALCLSVRTTTQSQIMSLSPSDKNIGSCSLVQMS